MDAKAWKRWQPSARVVVTEKTSRNQGDVTSLASHRAKNVSRVLYFLINAFAPHGARAFFIFGKAMKSFDTEEAAAFLKISTRTLQREIKKGSIKVGRSSQRRKVFLEPDLVSYLRD
jgi:hypothetical protein